MGKRSAAVILLWVLATVGVPHLLCAQEDTAWVRRYQNGYNENVHLDLDGHGNVCIGSTTWTDSTEADFLSLKYTADGTLEWSREYDGPAGGSDLLNALRTDAAGNVYLTGRSDGETTWADYATFKYSTHGTLLWSQRYNGLRNNVDAAYDVTVDAAGNVYVTGESYGAGTESDWATLKYDSTGNLLWDRRYDGYWDGYDGGLLVEADNSGNVYVAGYSTEEETIGGDLMIIKYDSSGNVLWTRPHPVLYSEWTEARTLMIDRSGYVYVTGTVDRDGGDGWDYDYLTVKYSGDGDLEWERLYSSAGFAVTDAANALDIDTLGNAVVTGRTDGTPAGYLTIKYSAAGDTLWQRVYDPSGIHFDEAMAIDIDASGNIYVTGRSKVDTELDIATIIYDPEGHLLWEGRYDGPVSGDDEGHAVRADGEGNVYVAGTSKGVTGKYDIVVIKYTPVFCYCPNLADLDGDEFITALDLGAVIDVLFAGAPDVKDVACPFARADFDVDGFTTALDLAKVIDHLFAGGGGPTDPCPN